MKLTTNPALLLLALTTAITSAGCGPAREGENDEADTGTSDPTDPSATDTTPVATCFVDGVEYQPGDEFESSDGCATLRCDQGIANIISDSFVVVEGDLALAAQADVAEVACLREVTGTLTISGSTSDISSLASLIRVGGDLEIRESALVSLVGLGGLSEIGGGLVVADNASLTTLAFAPYVSVFGDATIANNDALASLAGAEFLGGCGGCIYGPESEPPLLGDRGGHGGESTAGDEGTAGGEADSSEPGGDEAGLTAGDEAPEGGTFYGNILIADNDVLVDIDALSNLWFAWADLRFRGNLVLADISAIGALSQVRGTLEISGHPALDDAATQALTMAIDVWGTRIVCGNGAGAPC